MRIHAPTRARERRAHVRGLRGLRGDGLARSLQLPVDGLRRRGEAGVRRAGARAPARVPAAGTRLRRLAGGACPVCPAAGALERRAAGRLSNGRRALPGGRGRARAAVGEAHASTRCFRLRLCGRGRDLRRQPADAERPGIRAPGGSAGRMPVRRGRARVPARRGACALRAGRRAAGTGDREQGVGAGRVRARSARAAPIRG
jgi:hypothetical protein